MEEKIVSRQKQSQLKLSPEGVVWIVDVWSAILP